MSQAIINHKQGIKILEKFYGFDNAQTAHGYFSLSLLHFHAKQYDKAFVSILKSLYIFNVIGGELVNYCHGFILIKIASRMLSNTQQSCFDVPKYR